MQPTAPLRHLLWSFFLALMFGVSLLPAEDEPRWLTTPASIRLPERFVCERIHVVPMESQGSWVAMTVDPRGRIIAADQYGRLYRFDPRADEIRVEPLDIELSGAQGLLCAFDSLYVMVNEDSDPGLYRVWDADGDDRYDSQELLLPISGSGEHGPHAIILSPAGDSLYICAGNHTALPELDHSFVPRHWDEDHLLPRLMDPGGHATGIQAPGGYVCEVAPDGSACRLISVGFRNEYDIAFNRDGELFTFDADMEWDLGTPWYRPTRINHVVQGADFGWRSGSSKWSADYIDSLPAAVEIGPGSPTGICFGYGARFPHRYQDALFIADWSQGRILAVHLEPEGATYRGDFELFAAGAPLPVTDMVIHPEDGSLYFAGGGRRIQSAVYRIRYVGDADVSPTRREDASELPAAVRLRRRLERLQRPGIDMDDLEFIWQQLGHEDRWVRHAARVALEHQPIQLWKSRLKPEAETTQLQRLQSVVALAHLGHRNDLPLVIELLTAMPIGSLDVADQLDWLRGLQLAFIRLGPPEELGPQVVDALALFDLSDDHVLREVATLHTYLRTEDIEQVMFQWLRDTEDPAQRIHLLLVMRLLADRFDAAQSREYFEALRQIRFGGGGKSYGGYIDKIAQEAFERIPEAQRAEMQPLVEAIERSEFASLQVDRPFVKQWTVEAALAEIEDPLPDTKEALAAGAQLFTEVQCLACHRLGGRGGATGPDLTTVGARMSPRDLLVALIEPDETVSDQYRNHIFQLNDGRTVTGRIINLHENKWHINPDMRNPGQLITVQRDEIEEVSVSPTSTMPSSLLDTLTAVDISNLLAYLKSSQARVSEAPAAQSREATSSAK
ncbi:MAG: c-type cytochrome [Planctomycetota bacterium]